MKPKSVDVHPLRNKPTIGLTGGIGAGKSLVAHDFALLGCAVVNSDDLAHEAINQPEVIRLLRSWWGEDILAADGAVNRSAVGNIVFANATELQRLNGVLHPIVLEKRKILVRNYNQNSAFNAIVLDTPLLLESGLQRECDAIVFVNASYSVRLRRVETGRGWGPDELSAREKRQWPLDKKREMAQYIIENDGELTHTVIQVRQTLSQILSRFKRLRIEG